MREFINKLEFGKFDFGEFGGKMLGTTFKSFELLLRLDNLNA
jgi:hypothetical protein